MIFSVITISYNSEETIERTIRSVLAQTNRDFEYIIVDGASKDGTLDIVRKYESQFDGKMKWMSEPDTGIYNAMNKGINMSEGKIIGIVNSDDWLEPDALENVYRSYKEDDSKNETLYCGGIYYHYLNGDVRKWMVNLSSFKNQANLYVMSGIRHPAVFVPRAIYNKMGCFNEKMHLSADQDFILRCYFNGAKFKDLKCILSNMSEGGISTEVSEKSKKIAEEDRRIMLRTYGKKGVSYYWLWYSWKIRVLLKTILSYI